MKKMILIAAASMLATGPVIAQGMDDAPNAEQPTGGSVIEREMGVEEGADMDDDMTMPPAAQPAPMPPAPSTTMPPPPRTTTMPAQQPRMEYQRGQMPAGATTPSVPGGDYPPCTDGRTDMCINPSAM